MNFFLLTAICFIQHVNSHIMKRDVEPIVFDNDDLAPVVAMHPEKPVQIEFDINVANMESVGLDFNVNISKDNHPCGQPSCSETGNACLSAPCINNGTCSPHADGSFSCDCVDGYGDKYCQTDIDDCPASGCFGGNCSDLVADFNCDCYINFSGDLCETFEIQFQYVPYILNIYEPEVIGSSNNDVTFVDIKWQNDFFPLKTEQLFIVLEERNSNIQWIWTSGQEVGNTRTGNWNANNMVQPMNSQLTVEWDDSIYEGCLAFNKVGLLKEMDCQTYLPMFKRQ